MAFSCNCREIIGKFLIMRNLACLLWKEQKEMLSVSVFFLKILVLVHQVQGATLAVRISIGLEATKNQPILPCLE